MNQPESFSDELLGAYLDGELAPEERLNVEQLLAEEPECRQALNELQAISAGLRDLPKHSLGDDFYQRVLEATAAAEATPVSSVVGGNPVDSNPVDSNPVDSNPVALAQSDREFSFRPMIYAVAVIAVAVLVMVFGPQLVPTDPSPPSPPVVGVDPGTTTPEVFPDRPESVFVAEMGKLVLVVDVKLTAQGMSDDYLHLVLTGQKVTYDNDLEVDQRLEKTLLETRFINRPDQDAPQAQLYYVVAKGYQIDAAWNQLQSAEARSRVGRASLDVAALPKELDAFQQLRLADRQDLAEREMLARLDTSRARRVLIDLGALAQLSLGSNLSVSALFGAGDSQPQPLPPAPPAPSSAQRAPGMDTVYEVLFVVSQADEKAN